MIPSRLSIARARASNHRILPAALPRTRSPARLVSVFLVLACLLLPLAGCGSSDNGVAAKPAAAILAATRAAAQGASSVHVLTSAKITHGPSLSLDASLAKGQGHAKVSFAGISLEAIRTGETIYVKGNRSFASRLGGVLGVRVPANTWLKGPVKGPLGQTGAFTSITTELPLILGGTGKLTKGVKTTIEGQPAITLQQEHKLYEGTLYVATTGRPYPLKLIKRAARSGIGETGQTIFTNWNDTVTVTPPAHAIDITTLQHAGKKG